MATKKNEKEESPEIKLNKKLRELVLRGITADEKLVELAKLVDEQGSSSKKISGGEFIQLKLLIERLLKNKYSIKNILTAILPRSKPFQKAWLDEMAQILKQND